MLTIRLQRTGKKNQADFRIVLAEKESPVSKKFVEVLGSYNPRSKGFKVKEERVKYWIAQRIEMSPTVHNLFVTKGMLEGSKKVQAFTIPKKPVEVKAPEAAAATAEVSDSAKATSDVPPAVETPSPAEPTPEAKVEAPVAEAPKEEKPAEAIPEVA